ncbi:MAG: hypothetical protein AAF627_15970 [Myxococcota bacterium]
MARDWLDRDEQMTHYFSEHLTARQAEAFLRMVEELRARVGFFEEIWPLDDD